MTQLILIRHAETPWTLQGRYQGHSDLGLSSRGRQQAGALAERIRAWEIEKIYASSLKRARQTGEIISKKMRQKLYLDHRLKELHFGRWEGKTAKELLKQKEPSFLKWLRGQSCRPPGGESVPDLKKRVKDFLDEILKRHAGGRVAIVSHGGPLKMAILLSLKLAGRFFWSFRIAPASISVLNVSADSAELSSLNDTSHLQGSKWPSG